MAILRYLCAAALVVFTTLSAVEAQQCVSTASPVSQFASFPNLAASAVVQNGRGFGLAKVQSSSERPIWFALYDSTPGQISSDVLITPASLAGPMALFWTGSEYGLFYQTKDPRLMFQRITPAGLPLGPAQEVAALASGNNREFSVAWDASRRTYVLAYTLRSGENRGLWLAIMEPGGALRSNDLVTTFTASPAQPRVVATTAGVIVTFIHSSTALMHGVLRPDDGSIVPLSSIGVPGETSSLESNGSEVIWVTSAALPLGSELRWTRLDLAGNVTKAQARLLSPLGIDAEVSSVIWNGTMNEWAVAYYDSASGSSLDRGDLRLARLTPSGAVINRSFLSPDPLLRRLGSSYPIVWDGTAYAGSVIRPGPFAEGSQSYLIKQCPLRAQATSTRYVTFRQLAEFRAFATGGAPPYTYQWDAGDFGTSVSRTEVATYLYRQPGRYVVTLTVTDSDGAKTTATTEVIVALPKRRAAGK